MSRVYISIVLLLTLSICSVFSESCVEEVSGRNGRCVPFRHCRQTFDNGPQVCDVKRRTICCPEKQPSTTTTTTVKSSRISDKKCGEYSAYINSTETYYDIFGKTITKNVSNCGHISHELMIGGRPATENEFPHMALIGYGEGRFEDYKCGGSLISEQWVLSAAHCSNGAKHIKLGGLKRLEIEPTTKIFRIIENIKYPKYRSLYVDHDIVLFKMNEPVTLSLHILPICLQQTEVLPKTVIATGWGKTENTTGMSPVLMEDVLHYFPISSCQNYFEDEDEFEGTDFSNIVCAGSENPTYTCEGNSGSPLQNFNKDHYCMYTITGISAHGSSYCGRSASGEIYAKVFKYLDWIEGIVWPGE